MPALVNLFKGIRSKLPAIFTHFRLVVLLFAIHANHEIDYFFFPVIAFHGYLQPIIFYNV